MRPPSSSESPLKTFKLLLALSMQRTKLTHLTEVKMDGKDVMVGKLLRFQPFFLSRDHCYSEGEFVLRLPLYHLRAAKEKFGTDAVPMLLIAMAGAAVTATAPWRIFEVLPAHIVAVQSAMIRLLNKNTVVPWSDALPALLSGSEIAKTAKFDLGLQPFAVYHEEGKCPEVIEDANNIEKYAAMDGCIFPRDVSKSADLFHVQRQLRGNGHVLMEWQSKFFLADGLTASTVRDEVAKSAETLATVLIIYSATVGEQLRGATTDSVLILRSWDDKAAAMFAFSSSALLWRPAGDKDASYKNCVVATKDAAVKEVKEALVKQQQDAQWFQFPEKEASIDAKPVTTAAIIKVRVGLEVVVPNHELVKALLGANMFDALVALKMNKGSPDAVGAMITTLDEVFNNSTQQPQELKHMDNLPSADPFAQYSDATTMQVVVEAIAEKEGYSKEEVAPSLAILRSAIVKTAGNMRALSVEQIKELGLPPVVTAYMRRVKKGGK
jgi:hypothetical protein